MSLVTTLALAEPLLLTLVNTGPKGDPGLDGSGGAATYTFAYGDATPAPILMAVINKLIYTVTLHITEAFNGVGAAIVVGDAAQSDRLMAANRNNPAEIASFESTPNFSYSVNTQLLISITPGAGATQGKGVLTIDVQS